MLHYKFLGTHISEDLSWTASTSAVVKKAQQRLHFLRVLIRNNLGQELLVTFNHSTIKSALAYTYAITVWYGPEVASEGDQVSQENYRLCPPLPSLDKIAISRSFFDHPPCCPECITRCEEWLVVCHRGGRNMMEFIPICFLFVNGRIFTSACFRNQDLSFVKCLQLLCL